MKTISIMNVKGGVGKTTTAVNLAQIFATDHHLRTLLIDMDAQGDSSSIMCELTPEDLEGAGVYGLISSGGHYDEFTIPTRYRNLDILPACDDMFDLGMDRAEVVTKATGDLMDCLREDDAYDLCIIDCPPHFNACSVASLCNSDAVIIPVRMDAFSIQGCRYLLKQLEQMAELADVETMILPTFYKSYDTVCQQALSMLCNSTLVGYVSDIPIRYTVKADESTFYGVPVCEYSKFSGAGRDYRDLADKINKDIVGGADNGL